MVQPAAALYFGSAVVEVRSGSYSCRSRNSRRGARLSEHSFGNALDVMAFRFADGREVSVVKGWRGAQEEQEFLREVFTGACNYFTTVLGPGADAFHYDHFHLDLARHDPRGERHVCKPVLKFTPRLGTDGASEAAPPQRRQWQPAEPAPTDQEEDDDPFAVSAKPAPRDDLRLVPAAGAGASGLRAAAVPHAAPANAPPGYPADAATPRPPIVLQPQLWTGSTIY